MAVESTPSMLLYGRYASPFVRRVAVTLNLYGIAYRHVPLMPFGPDKLDLARINPIARVPALVLADGEMLTDSAAIIDHLDQVAGPDRALTPPAGAARRQVLRLLAVALGANDKLVASLYERHFRPRETWSEPWLATCEQQVRDGFGWLDQQWVGPWFTGERMSQADVTVAVFWLFACGKRPGFFSRMGCGNLHRLVSQLQSDAAFVATTPEAEKLTGELS